MSGRFKNNYQQSPPPNSNHFGHGTGGGSGGTGSSGGGRGHKDKGVTFMPGDIKIPKPPKQPDKPLPAYMRYSRKVWEKVKNEHPEMKMWDIGKLIGEQWRSLPEDERQGFNAEYEIEKSEYQEAMKTYHSSPAYREWLKAKEKAQQAIQEQQMSEKLMGGSMPKEEPRFQLQQIEDDDDEGDFSIKHIASARYQRNHRLITEILSDAIVPDVKTIVTRPRLENLKRQVQSLMQHQRKLESEILDMEEKFSAKKQKILDHSAEFEDKIKSFLGPLPPLETEEKPENQTSAEDIKEEPSPETKQQEEKEIPMETNEDTNSNSLSPDYSHTTSVIIQMTKDIKADNPASISNDKEIAEEKDVLQQESSSLS